MAIRHNSLGLLLHDLGEHAEAREHLEQARTIWQQAHGPVHHAVATALNNLGLAAKAAGDRAAARLYFEQAQAIAAGALGSDHPHVVSAAPALRAKLQAFARAAFQP